MTNALENSRKLAIGFVVVCAMSGLGGCGGVDGVELNGKIFEAAGLTGSLGGKRVEPKTEARTPLVLPPQSDRLPEPGSLAAAPQAATADQSWPNDPDKTKAQNAAAQKQAQAEYCRDGNWKEKALDDKAAGAPGPDGSSCGSGIFGIVGKSVFGN